MSEEKQGAGQGKGTATIPASENAIAAVEGVAVNGMCLIPAGGEEERAVVLDYLYRCVWKHKKSIREMLMEDSAAMSAGEMRYFDKRLWGKIPSWGYWKLYYGRLDGAVRDEIELTERELLKSGYVEEMEGIARSGEGDAAEARVFGYWQKLHKIADAESARIESRSVKREMRNAGFSAGVDRTIEVLRKIKDADLIEMREVIEGVAKEVSNGGKE